MRERSSQPRAALAAAALALALAAAGLLAAGCGGAGADIAAGDEDGPAESPPVEALPARSGTLPLEERLSGTVKAENQVTVRAEIEAAVLEVHVRSGAAVERGQPLVRLDSQALDEQLRQAEANLRLADANAAEARARTAELRARVVRSRTLAGQELISELELETLEAQLAAAEAAAAQAEASVDEARSTVEERRTAQSKTVVRAPVSGRVGRRTAEIGMLVDPSTPLFVVGNLDDLIVEVPLTEEMLGYVEVGQTAVVRTPALRGSPVRAKLDRISPFLAPGSFSTTGEIDLDNRGDRLKPGMFVTVDILYGETEEATVVPSSALWEEPTTGRWGIYVVTFPDGDVPAEGEPQQDVQPTPRPVEFRAVEILAEGRDRAGVRGIDPGEWVVVLGQHLLRPDAGASARVRVASWDRVLELQEVQREDLLQGYLDKQQRWAKEHGAKVPTNEEFLRGRIEDAAPAPAPAAQGAE